MEQWKDVAENLKKEIRDCDFLLVGIGNEWKKVSEENSVYVSLYEWIGGKNYFIVTMLTDGCIMDAPLDDSKIVAPCGNENWHQCSEACTKSIWEKGEVSDGACPYCHAPLTGNTIESKQYIGEGYLLQWEKYKKWLSRTLNKKLLILELGVDFKYPTVIRWPFEKTAFFNEKSHMYRVNKTFFQIPEEMKERIVSVPVNSAEFIQKYDGKA